MGYRTLRRRERIFARTAAARIRYVATRLSEAVESTVRRLGSTFTVIILPLDHRPPLRFSCSLGRFLLIAFLLIDGTIAIPALRFRAARFESGSLSAASLLDRRLSDYDELRDGISGLVSVSAPLEDALRKMNGTLSGFTGARRAEKRDLPALFGFARRENGATAELAALESLRLEIETSTATIKEAGQAVRNVRANMAEVPVLWPIAGGIGHVSMLYGPNPNPFTGIAYFHLGLDIGNYRDGDPIVATADGTVVSAYYDGVSGYGNNVTIQHRHGYLTRYGHMQSMKVRPGQKVVRGQVIGILGHTGRVDGPHVHYEMRLGPDLLDPLTMMSSAGKKGAKRP